MKKIIKIILFSLFFIIGALYYFIYTASGKVMGYRMLSYAISQKADLNIVLQDFDVHAYPYMKASLLVEDKYTLDMDGYYKDRKLNLRYTLTSACIESNICNIEDEVNIQGHVKGPLGHVTIDGEGTGLDGRIVYSGIKQRHAVKDVDVKMTDINTTKLFKLMGQDPIFQGKADASLHFKHISKKKRIGHLDYVVKKSRYHDLDVHLDAHIEVKNDTHFFDIHFYTPTAALHLLEGKYERKKKKAYAIYLLDIQNVADLKPLVHADYKGAFYAVGELKYDKEIQMQGMSRSLGGMLDIFYDKDTLRFYMHNIPLSPLMGKFSLPSLFDSNVTGEGHYAVKTKALLFDATLSPLTFKESALSKPLSTKADINLSKEVFDSNHLYVVTKKGKLYTTLKIENKKNHIRLKNTYINNENSAVQSDIDIQLSTYNLKGALRFKLDKYTKSNDTYLSFNGLVQKHYALALKGMFNKTWVSMDYDLSSGRFPSHVCTIVDDVNLTGHFSGAWKRLHIEGKGTALNGHVSYDAVKKEDKLEDVTVKMKNIHAQKLSTLLGHPELPFGKVDLEARFDVLSTQRNKGDIHYLLRKSSLYTLPFTLDANIAVDDEKQRFTADLTLADAKVKLTKGYHNNESNATHAFYTLDVKDLQKLEPLFGYKYRGSFYAMGTVDYLKALKIHGLSKSFSGFTEFNYDNEKLDINLADVSFQQIMHLFPYPKLLDAKTMGNILYDFKTEALSVKAHLKNAKFLHTDIIDTIYDKSDVNMLKETFANSNLDLTYKNNILLGNLIMENEQSHFSLTNTQINTKQNTINAYFDVNMQKKEFSGKVYGSLDKPKVNLNLQKLIRHEMDTQLDSIMGEGNRKMMQNMPMGGVAEDMASGVGGAFMGIFF